MNNDANCAFKSEQIDFFDNSYIFLIDKLMRGPYESHFYKFNNDNNSNTFDQKKQTFN